MRNETIWRTQMEVGSNDVIADFHRRRRPKDPLPEDLIVAKQSPDNPLFAELAAVVRAFIDELPLLYRAPLLLSEIDGRPHADVARRLGLTLTATRSRVRRGCQLLKQRLQDCCRLKFNRAGQVTECEPRQADCCD